MPVWIEKIELNKAIADSCEQFDLERVEEPMPDEAKALLMKEIRRSTRLSRFASEIEAAGSIAAVNRILERVYDEADRCRIWCGMG